VDRRANPRAGFTLIELLLAMAVFLVICGAMFSLLQLSQQRYSSETQLSGSFQEARLAMDQIARDVNDAGFPSAGMFSKLPVSTSYTVGPVAWWPNYPTSPCTIGATCSPSPGNFDLIIETTIGTTVSWIRYQLVGTTLMRGSIAKNGTDPIGATSTPGVMVPFLVNVMNNAMNTSPAQFTQITASYPTMYPGGNPVPIFQYSCDTPAGVVGCTTPAAGAYNTAVNIRDVDITLIVMTQLPDSQTQQIKLIELNGRGHRLNPAN
jgi:prepilin-type N-terminal cleavage/methylation domain-containing protein